MDIKNKEVNVISSARVMYNHPKILIVDDEIFNIEALKMMLESNFGLNNID